MCVQAKEPFKAIVDKVYSHFELNRVICGFNLVGPQYTGPVTKRGSGTII